MTTKTCVAANFTFSQIALWFLNYLNKIPWNQFLYYIQNSLWIFQVTLLSGAIKMPGLIKSNVTSSIGHYRKVSENTYQLCACSDGKLFISHINALCVADYHICTTNSQWWNIICSNPKQDFDGIHFTIVTIGLE